MIRFRPFQSWIGVHRRRRRHGRWRRRRSRGWCETAFCFPCLGIGIFWSRWKEIPWKMDSRETNRKGEFQFQFQATKKKKWEWVNIIRQCFLDVSVVVLGFHLPFCQFVKPKSFGFFVAPNQSMRTMVSVSLSVLYIPFAPSPICLAYGVVWFLFKYILFWGKKYIINPSIYMLWSFGRIKVSKVSTFFFFLKLKSKYY